MAVVARDVKSGRCAIIAKMYIYKIISKIQI